MQTVSLGVLGCQLKFECNAPQDGESAEDLAMSLANHIAQGASVIPMPFWGEAKAEILGRLPCEAIWVLENCGLADTQELDEYLTQLHQEGIEDSLPIPPSPIRATLLQRQHESIRA